MRQRKVKHEQERMIAAGAFAVKDPKGQKGHWNELFPGKDLYLEMGCGRGQFLVKQALKHPENAYVGAEGRESIVVRAMELIQAGGYEEDAVTGIDFTDAANIKHPVRVKHEPIPNAICIAGFVDDVADFFAEGELSGVYCNFSDPWPKARHEKRRLTSMSFLEGYRKAVKPGGFIEIKTDNDDLFSFTMEMVREGGFTVEELSYDLHRSDYEAKEITTQYEERFMELGTPIKYCRIRL